VNFSKNNVPSFFNVPLYIFYSNLKYRRRAKIGAQLMPRRHNVIQNKSFFFMFGYFLSFA